MESNRNDTARPDTGDLPRRLAFAIIADIARSRFWQARAHALALAAVLQGQLPGPADG